eukprot:c46043_g1_i1 orf=1-186(-)
MISPQSTPTKGPTARQALGPATNPLQQLIDHDPAVKHTLKCRGCSTTLYISFTCLWEWPLSC